MAASTGNEVEFLPGINDAGSMAATSTQQPGCPQFRLAPFGAEQLKTSLNARKKFHR
jgi:hypothetical protein